MMFERQKYCAYDVCFRCDDFRCCFECIESEDCEIVCKAYKEQDYDCQFIVDSIEEAME